MKAQKKSKMNKNKISLIMNADFLFVYLLVFSIYACKPSDSKNTENAIEASRTMDNKQIAFDWLLGAWQRSDDKEGRQTFESWSKLKNEHYLSHGYTLAESDTVWQEYMDLLKIDSVWQMQIKQAGESSATVFTLTDFNGDSFVSICPENEFPKQIIYQLDGDSLRAEISGGGPVIPFTFFKVEG